MARFVMSVVDGIKYHGGTSYSWTGVGVGSTMLFYMFMKDFIIYDNFHAIKNL
jgi:hypothetical protein